MNTGGRPEPTPAPDAFAVGAREGTYRARTIEHTLELLWDQRSEFGVSRVSDITDLDRVGLPVFVAVRPMAHPHNLTVSAGKGTSRLSSLVSCLAEAFERHWAEPQHHTFRRASARELDAEGSRRLAPHDLGKIRGNTWTVTQRIDWLAFHDLGPASADVWVPAAYAVSPYTSESAERIGPASSDGIAAGNTFDEAALHALMELLERDACSFGVWMHRGRRICRDSLPAEALSLVEAFDAADLETTTYQFDAILDIPVFYVTLCDRRSKNPMLLCAGAGAHIDGNVAIMRALTEAAQSRACTISGGREDLAPKYLDNRTLGFETARSGLERWDHGFSDGPFRRWGTLDSLSTPERSLSEVVDGLVAAGLHRILLRDLSPAEEPLSVVSAVVPGLECVEGPTSPAGSRFRAAMKQYAQPQVRSDQ